jgi:excisionase family DNA binding protein
MLYDRLKERPDRQKESPNLDTGSEWSPYLRDIQLFLSGRFSYCQYGDVYMDNEFLTAAEIAETLKISKALAYRLLAHGEIPSVRFGRTVRARLEDLEAFINRHVSGGYDVDIASPRTEVTLRAAGRPETETLPS